MHVVTAGNLSRRRRVLQVSIGPRYANHARERRPVQVRNQRQTPHRQPVRPNLRRVRRLLRAQRDVVGPAPM